MVNWSLSRVIWGIAVEEDGADYSVGELELNLENGNIVGFFKPTKVAIETIANTLENCGIELDDTIYDLANRPIFKVEGDKFHWKISTEVQNPTVAQATVLDTLYRQFKEDVEEMWSEFN